MKNTMKNNIKIILIASSVFTGARLHAAEAPPLKKAKITVKTPKTFEQFTQLPTELQTLIALAIKEGKTPLDAAKRLGQLRRVNRRMKDVIESPFYGKILMQKIADRFSSYEEQQPYEKKWSTVYAALTLATPGSLTWLKDQLNNGLVHKYNFDRYLKETITAKRLSAQQIIELTDDPNYILEPNQDTLLSIAVFTDQKTLIDDLIKMGADPGFTITDDNGYRFNPLNTFPNIGTPGYLYLYHKGLIEII
jgi:hypothetical protein